MVRVHGQIKETITMQDVLHQLEIEFWDNIAEAFDIFEWYCKTYNVSVGDAAPATVRREVFGI